MCGLRWDLSRVSRLAFDLVAVEGRPGATLQADTFARLFALFSPQAVGAAVTVHEVPAEFVTHPAAGGGGLARLLVVITVDRFAVTMFMLAKKQVYACAWFVWLHLCGRESGLSANVYGVRVRVCTCTRRSECCRDGAGEDACWFDGKNRLFVRFCGPSLDSLFF